MSLGYECRGGKETVLGDVSEVFRGESQFLSALAPLVCGELMLTFAGVRLANHMLRICMGCIIFRDWNTGRVR